MTAEPHLRLVHPTRRFEVKFALSFLSVLDPAAGQFTFQTAADAEELKQRGKRGKTIHGPLFTVCDELERANNEGYGVHVTINATKGTRRTKEDVTHVRAVWCEVDDGVPREYPVPPSLIVRTSRIEGTDLFKHHCYWLCDGPQLR